MQSGTLDRSNYKGKTRSGRSPLSIRQLPFTSGGWTCTGLSRDSRLFGDSFKAHPVQKRSLALAASYSSFLPPSPSICWLSNALSLSLFLFDNTTTLLSFSCSDRLFKKKGGKRPETPKSGRKLAALEPSASLPAGLAHSARPTHSLTPYTADSEGTYTLVGSWLLSKTRLHDLEMLLSVVVINLGDHSSWIYTMSALAFSSIINLVCNPITCQLIGH